MAEKIEQLIHVHKYPNPMYNVQVLSYLPKYINIQITCTMYNVQHVHVHVVPYLPTCTCTCKYISIQITCTCAIKFT